MHPGALTPRDYQSTLTQLGQVPGNRRLGRLQGFHQITHTHLALPVQQADQAEAGVITQAFAQLCRGYHVFRHLYICIFGNTDIIATSDKRQVSKGEGFVTESVSSYEKRVSKIIIGFAFRNSKLVTRDFLLTKARFASQAVHLQ